jgi:uncharacterized membrane protein YgcG
MRVGVIPEVAGAWDLVCMKNFGVIGRVQRASTNGAHVPFEGHFERLRDCNLLFTRHGGGGGGGSSGGGGAGKLTRAVFLVRSEGHPPGA